MSNHISYSVVAPVFNEKDNLPELYRRLKDALSSLAAEDWEIVLVDDGSCDDSWSVIERLHQTDQRVVGLRFSRNFGHHVALMAGIDVCRGERVATMDSDLQDLPEELVKLAAKMDTGYDLVYAERLERQHTLAKRITSRLFFKFLNWAVDAPYPVTGAVFRLMNRQFVDELCRIRERHRLFTGLTAWLGFRQAAVVVTHGKRYAGTTKYSFRRMLKLAADSATSFSVKPLDCVVYLGGVISVLAILLAVYIIVRHFVGTFAILGWASLMAAIMLLGGMNLVVVGVVGQYVGRIFEEQKNRPVYVVRTRLGGGRIAAERDVRPLAPEAS